MTLLWWNEVNAAGSRSALAEIRRDLVTINAKAPGPARRSRPVHAVADLTAKDRVGDGEFIKPGPWLAVRRKIEMYQWVEESRPRSRKPAGGGQASDGVSTYRLAWAEGRLPSESFRKPSKDRQNPRLSVAPGTFKAKSVTFGAMDGRAVLDQAADYRPLRLNPGHLAKKHELNNGMILIRSRRAPGNGHAVGDIRISYQVLSPGPYSVIAGSDGRTFAPHRAKNGKTNFLVRQGRLSADQMITGETGTVNSVSWVLRCAGIACLWLGLMLLSGPITAVLDIIPVLGTTSRLVLGMVFAPLAVVLAALTVGLAKVASHPVILISLLAGMTVAFLVLAVRRQQQVKRRRMALGGASGGPGAPPGDQRPGGRHRVA